MEWDHWRIEPHVITPQIYKNTRAEPFATLWREAHDALSRCRKLVVIGYSLPPTDFGAVRLLVEAFATSRIDELVVINPDPSVAERLARLIRPSDVTRLDNLHTYYGVPEISAWTQMTQEQEAQQAKQPKQPLIPAGQAVPKWSDLWSAAATPLP
jgi:hypothetical protein